MVLRNKKQQENGKTTVLNPHLHQLPFKNITTLPLFKNTGIALGLATMFNGTALAENTQVNNYGQQGLDASVISQQPLNKNDVIEVPYASENFNIDGKLTEGAWQSSQWYPINFVILGEALSQEDFSGQYALTWNEQALYLAVKFVDDKLLDQIADPTKKYWDDDCLEIFIDEDASGGEHRTSHNAFAYHLALDNQVPDIGTNGKAQLYNDHVENSWRSYQHYRIWESKIHVFADTYQDNQPAILHSSLHSSQQKTAVKPSNNVSVKLSVDKKLGFMLAYCDNDGSSGREHFIGSHVIDGQGPNNDKNLGYKTADVFGKLKLVK